MLSRFPSFPVAMLALAVSGSLNAASLDIDADTAAARDRIKPAAIAAHIRFLASDLLEGRETGSRGFELGANYVAAQFAALGLDATGDDGTFFQKIDFRSARLITDRSSMSIDDNGSVSTLTPKVDVLIKPDFARDVVDVHAPAVFAGFGIVAPELGRDDYAGIDVRDKVVVYLTGAPATFPHNQRAYYSNTQVKEELAAARGAIGVIVVKSNPDELRYPFEKSARQSDIVAMKRLNRGVPAEFTPQLRGIASLSRGAAQRLFAHAPQPIEKILADADKGLTESFPLKVSVSIKTASAFDTVHSENVVATLRGSDPALRDEYVVLSAHLDHLGEHGPAADKIFNGAFDNASGIACLIEIARAFASMPQPPARSILFAAFTGEEKGEEGSGMLARHPPVRGSIVADVNMDMFLMLYPVKDLVPFGGEHSSLGETAKAAASAMGFELSPDPNPEEVRFIRSDQYSFVREGIPAIILKAGSKSSDPSIDGEKASREWLRTIYHTPKDDLSQPMDFASGARYAQTNFLLTLAVANDPLKPRWNVGDFFGDRFGRARVERERVGGERE
ncbi:MAG TPA: M28 family metallopeptidase [Thermoanaerobaculia bacterium]|nr:M28 family metallopeptidase [Thermoanaerobaculia bacterium]